MTIWLEIFKFWGMFYKSLTNSELFLVRGEKAHHVGG